MELFTLLFGDLLASVYHCFDRIVIYGYLSGPSRPAQVGHFFRNVSGVAAVSKEVLSQRTAEYQAWVEAYARNHRLPIEWAEKGSTQGRSCPSLATPHGEVRCLRVYFIFKSMEQGATFRVSVPRYATKDTNYRILAPQRSRFTHYYLSGHSFIEQQLRHAQIGFRKIDNAFLAVDDVAALLAAADKLSADIIRKRLDYWILILGRSSPPRNVSSSTCHAFIRSPRSSIAATSPSSATSPSTSS
jgi:hypothetical protein